MIHFLSNLIGLIGVFFVLATYFFCQLGKLKADDDYFLYGNLIGSLCVIFSLIYNWNVSSFIIEIAWTAITLYGIYRKKKECQQKRI